MTLYSEHEDVCSLLIKLQFNATHRRNLDTLKVLLGQSKYVKDLFAISDKLPLNLPPKQRAVC